eukprot:3370230-Prymnesium_polylepis.1
MPSPEEGRWRQLATRAEAVLMHRRASDAFAPPGVLFAEARRRWRTLRRVDAPVPVLDPARCAGCRSRAPTCA